MSTVKLPLGTPDEIPEEKLVNEALESLVNGTLTSKDAAQKIDSVIVTDLRSGKSNSHPLGWEHYLWDSIGRSAMVVPADHAGQDRLVQFLQDIQNLPKTTIPFAANGAEHEKIFWTLNASNGYSGLSQWLWELKEGGFQRHERPSEDSSFLHQNFAAFLARLLSNGVVEATRLSDLIRPSVFATKNASNSNLEEYVIALCGAKQWILHAGDALYEMCQKKTLIEIPGPKWTPTVWSGWKNKFEQAAKVEALGAEGREIAAQALERMGQIEQRGVTTTICETFGFTSIEQEEDGE